MIANGTHEGERAATALEELGIRRRGLYSTKDRFGRASLMAGVPSAWLENRCRVDYSTLHGTTASG